MPLIERNLSQSAKILEFSFKIKRSGILTETT